MPKPERKVNVPLGFREFLSDLLKVNPEDDPQDSELEDSEEREKQEEE